MNVEDVRFLYAYNRWANLRILDAVSLLSPEQFGRDVATSHSSVHGTLVHMLGSEGIWLRRCEGISPRAMICPADLPDPGALRARWEEIDARQSAFLDRLRPEDLDREITYRNTRREEKTYPLRRIMVHAVNHATYHRGQVATMLRQHGAESVTTDMLLYLEEGQSRRS